MTEQIKRLTELLESKNAKNIRVNDIRDNNKCLIAKKGAATYYIYFYENDMMMNVERNSKDTITRGLTFEEVENKIKRMRVA